MPPPGRLAAALGGRPSALPPPPVAGRPRSPSPGPSGDDGPPAEGGAAFASLMRTIKKQARKRARESGGAGIGGGRRGASTAAPVAPADAKRASASALEPASRPAPPAKRRARGGAATADASATATAAPDPSDAFLDTPLTASIVADLDAANKRLAPLDGPPLPRAWGAGARWLVSGEAPGPPPATLLSAGVRPRVVTHWSELRERDGGVGGSGRRDPTPTFLPELATDSAASLFTMLRTYKDVLYTARTPPTHPASPRGGADADGDALLLHAAAHVAAAADRVRKNNDRIKAADGGAAAAAAARDQGFARATVLLVTPLRSLAHAAVLRLAALLQRETRADSIQGKARFDREYGPGSDGEGEEEGRAGKRRHPKPADHAALFAGNADDHFRIGVRVTKGAVRLYSEFGDADVIAASPLGLATHLEAGGPAGADALAGVELVIVDRADVCERQNWAHVVAALAALNRLPTATPATDIMRVREAALGGWADRTRQLVVAAARATPAVAGLFAARAASAAGRARLDAPPPGVLAAAPPLVQLAFERLPNPPSPADAADARFAHFRGVVWPRVREAAAPGLVLVVPTYFDYVRVKKLLKATGVDAADCGEYVAPRDAARARTAFAACSAGAAATPRLLLLTERSHFYHRAAVRGVSSALFYAPPDDEGLFRDAVSWVGARGRAAGDAPAGGRATCLFSRLDALALERIVGRDRAARMLQGGEPAYVFC